MGVCVVFLFDFPGEKQDNDPSFYYPVHNHRINEAGNTFKPVLN